MAEDSRSQITRQLIDATTMSDAVKERRRSWASMPYAWENAQKPEFKRYSDDYSFGPSERAAHRAAQYSGPEYTDTDPEGRPLRSLFVAGMGDKDIPLSSEEIADLASVVSDFPRYQNEKDANKTRPVQNGRLDGYAETGGLSSISVIDPEGSSAPNIRSMALPLVTGHEIGHVISAEDFTNLDGELKQFIAINPDAAKEASNLTKYYAFQPDTDKSQEALAELFANYMKIPSYAKKKYPVLSAWLRQKVNTNPKINHILTFSKRDDISNDLQDAIG